MEQIRKKRLSLLYIAIWIPIVLTSAVSWPLRRFNSSCQQLSNNYPNLLALPNSTVYNEVNAGKQEHSFVALVYTTKGPQVDSF